MLESLSEQIVRISILAVPLLLGLTCHELSHGLAALALGDPTAKLAGRLTMNPLKHLDPMGAIAFILANIGWAKPVPVNAMYFKRPMRDMMLVSIAGPGANFLLAALFAGGFHLLLPLAIARPDLQSVMQPLVLICQAGVIVNLMLGFFNLLPIPPLDGYSALALLLPESSAHKLESFRAKLHSMSFILLLLGWKLFDLIFQPLLSLAIVLLYPGRSYS
jgi:Zn-dependent protease